MSSMQIQLFQF